MNKQIIGMTLAAIFASNTAQALVIDDFSGDEFVSSDAPLTSVAAGNSIDGFARTITATTSGDFTSISINSEPNLGLYAHSQNAGVFAYSQIDFAIGGMDLTEGDTINSFRLSLNSIDLNGVIGVIADGAIVSLSTNSILIDNGLNLPSYADFLFSEFTGVDFTNINEVSFFVDGTGQDALDVTLDHFGTTCSALNDSGGSGVNPNEGVCPRPISEPVSLGLLGLGLMVFGVGRQRKEK